jgi:hypothetical protein
MGVFSRGERNVRGCPGVGRARRVSQAGDRSLAEDSAAPSDRAASGGRAGQCTIRLTAILESFAERDGDVDGIIAIRARDLSTAYRYLSIAQLCLDHGRGPEALKWTEDGLWQFEDRPDDRLISFASDLYRRIGREEEADKLLWRMFELRPSVDLYERLKSAAGVNRISQKAVRDRAFAWLRSRLGTPQGRTAHHWSAPAEILVRLMMAEELLAEAWTIANGYGCGQTLLKEVAEASEQSHPAEALKVYAGCVEQMIRLGGQSNYEQASRLIGRMRVIREGLGETAQHLAFLYDVMSRHKAKRNFMKLLTVKQA